MIVAIFSHTVATNAASATREAVRYVNAQTQMPAPARAQLVATIRSEAAAAAKSGGGAAASRLSQAGQTGGSAPAGSPQAVAQQRIEQHIGAIYQDTIGRSFRWPFYAAALAALLALFPALLTGRRLGEHEGHEDMTRAERGAAAGASR